MSWTRRAVAPAAGKGGGPVPEFQGQRAAARVPGRVLLLPLENPFGKSEGVRVQTGAEPGDKREGERVWGCTASLQPPPASPSKICPRVLEVERKVPRGRAGGCCHRWPQNPSLAAGRPGAWVTEGEYQPPDPPAATGAGNDAYVCFQN